MKIMPERNTIIRFFLWLAIFFGFFVNRQQIYAAIGSCSADVSPTSVATSTSQRFTFTFSSVESMQWIKISRPSDNFTVTGGTASGWNASVNNPTDVIFSLGGSGSTTINVDATSGGSEAGSANWTVEASDDAGGASPTSCTGSLGTAISGAGADTTAPTISSIVVSDISDTQAKITWTTDESSTSVVDYGTTEDYGSTKTGDSGTSHSVSITSLTANTTYHYNVKSADAAGNTGESGDNTFVTAKQGTTTTTTVTGATRTVTATPTPTPIPDRIPPKTTLTTTFDKPFTEAPTIIGKATDPSGVSNLEYSLDDGKSFLPIDEIEGLETSTATFAFTPLSLMDDNYIVKIRATDEKGNVGVSKGVTMIIDRLPPMIGGMILTLGPQVIEPANDGGIIVLAGISYKLSLSAVGGPTEIQLLGNQTDLGTLRKNFDNGLWSTTVRFDTPGTYALQTKSVDGAGNKKDRVLPTITVIPSSVITNSDNQPVTNGHVLVYFLDYETKRFVLWDGASYGQQNPFSIKDDGSYAFYLPNGTYYLRVKAQGYQDAVSQIFTLDQGFPITQSISLTRKFAIRIGSFFIPLPDFRETQMLIHLTAPTITTSGSLQASLPGKELPYFSFPYGENAVTATALHGKPTIVTFLNTWLPQAPSQLAILNDLVKKKEVNFAVIIPQETAGSVSIFSRRGGYLVPLIADVDGVLVEALHITSMPTHLFINRKGIVESVKTGLLTREELLDQLVK